MAITIQAVEQDVDMDEEKQIAAEAQAFFHSFVHEAVNVRGDHEIPHHDVEIPTTAADLVRFREGREFFDRYFAPMGLAITLSFFVNIAIQRSTAIFFRTEFDGSKDAVLRRAVSTFTYVMKWVQDGIEDKNGTSAQSVYKVRKIHREALRKIPNFPLAAARRPKKCQLHLLEAIHADLEDVSTPDHIASFMTESPAVQLSQYDMAQTMHLTFYLVDLAPASVGIYTDEGYESFVYTMAMISRLLGIEDRFNLALRRPAVRRAVSARVWNEIIVPGFKNFPPAEFLNLCASVEAVLPLDMVPLMVHMAAKTALRDSGPSATATLAHVNFAGRLIGKTVDYFVILVKYRPILWLINSCTKFILGTAISLLEWRWRRNDKLTKTKERKFSAKSGCPV